MKIYLAGGFHSGWQNKVKVACPKHEYYNPRDNEYDGELDIDRIGAWDFHYIRQCDVLFAYMERTNPSGIGLATEVGYAYGIGKTVILVLEKGHEMIKDRYLAFLTKACHIVFDNFGGGVEFLKTFND